MKLLSILKEIFLKKPVQKKKEFSFTVDNSPTFKSKTDAIPELKALHDKVVKRQPLQFEDIQTYFKHYENGKVPETSWFKIKPEFFENATFTVIRANAVYDEDRNITSFTLVVKDEFTGLDILMEAPASFFTEFATTVTFAEMLSTH